MKIPLYVFFWHSLYMRKWSDCLNQWNDHYNSVEVSMACWNRKVAILLQLCNSGWIDLVYLWGCKERRTQSLVLILILILKHTSRFRCKCVRIVDDADTHRWWCRMTNGSLHQIIQVFRLIHSKVKITSVRCLYRKQHAWTWRQHANSSSHRF